MTKEEAIKIINCYDIGFYDLSGEKIPADKLAEAFDMAIEALQRTSNALPTHECVKATHECVDLIRREDALDLPDINVGKSEQLRPKGKWIVSREDSRGVCCCNNCFEQFAHVPMNGGEVPWKFCPNCGADMRGADDDI